MPPSAPLNLKISSASISFSSPQYLGGSHIQRYEVTNTFMYNFVHTKYLSFHHSPFTLRLCFHLGRYSRPSDWSLVSVQQNSSNGSLSWTSLGWWALYKSWWTVSFSSLWNELSRKRWCCRVRSSVIRLVIFKSWSSWSTNIFKYENSRFLIF